MAKTSPKHTPEEIQAAVAKVRAFYEVGQRSRKERSGRAAYADDEAGKDARAAGINPDTLRAARRFADPERGYTTAELDVLFAEFREFGFGFGTSSVIRLLSVWPRKQRARLQRKAIKGGWSLSRLEFEIAKEFGTRKAGGINPARKMVREHKDLVVAGGVTIVTGRGATPCWVWSGTVGSKESSDGHRVTRWTW
jgi:hypothetical protein